MDWKVLSAKFLSNLSSILGDPVAKGFSIYLVDRLETSQDLESFLEEISVDNPYLELPPSSSNFIRKSFNEKYCTLVRRYVEYVAKYNDSPFNIHQAFVNTKKTIMDSQKLDIILLFSAEWV